MQLSLTIDPATARVVWAAGPNRSAKADRLRVVDASGAVWARWQRGRGAVPRCFSTEEGARRAIERAGNS